ncbi:HK97-gp10 family putative phage morphogenesis protein [Lysinibacillus sp. UGB7]|uniref:HK97-gp10 family putative phage morphogenesis protein n=1 Tax=Lysinibacillus sp. UGB7 TaxID=3411039 RepID=UPI003B7FE2EF
MDVQFTGLDGILANLARLPLEENEENLVVTKGAKITQKAIIEEAPIGTERRNKAGKVIYKPGTLKKNIKIKRAVDGVAIIHTSKGYHGHLVEFGRSAGSTMTKKNGKTQKVTWGSTTANPFFTRGFESSENEAKQVMANEIRRIKNL